MRLTGVPAPPPRRIRGLERPVSFGGRECALLRSGKMACWSYRNYGQRGDGRVVIDVEDFNDLFVASRVQGLRDAMALTVTAGVDHACALRRGGGDCWGTNFFGQLGDGTQEDRTHPVAARGLPGSPASTKVWPTPDSSAISGSTKPRRKQDPQFVPRTSQAGSAEELRISFGERGFAEKLP
jgi:alpha-tubulin suppressor-like RCC1 family protein